MTSVDIKHWVVIPAAGIGSRMQSDTPKQYLSAAGKPLILHCIERFSAMLIGCRIVVALADNDDYGRSLIHDLGLDIDICVGGAERADSVRNAVEYIRTQDGHNPWVWVHDAARPYISERDILALRRALNREAVGALLAQRSVDTLKRVVGGRAVTTEDRSEIWRALTPQVARAELLAHAYNYAQSNELSVTDEASAIELLALSLAVVEARDPGIKVTYAADIEWVEQQLRQIEKA